MGNESSGHGLHSFFAQRLHGTDLDKIHELPKPDSELEGGKGVLENILRWEDDGGQMMGTGDPADRSDPTTPPVNHQQMFTSH